jgi:deoxyribonuclease V
VGETVVEAPVAAPYRPGVFCQRELPPLLAVLRRVRRRFRVVVVDGYVWLDGHGRPGLGAHLYEALRRRVPVVGVAKSRFGLADFAVPVLRGCSRQPLFVTAAGMPAAEAAQRVRDMHGACRIPTVLKRVDRMCRGRMAWLGANHENPATRRKHARESAQMHASCVCVSSRPGG